MPFQAKKQNQLIKETIKSQKKNIYSEVVIGIVSFTQKPIREIEMKMIFLNIKIIFTDLQYLSPTLSKKIYI